MICSPSINYESDGASSADCPPTCPTEKMNCLPSNPKTQDLVCRPQDCQNQLLDACCRTQDCRMHFAAFTSCKPQKGETTEVACDKTTAAASLTSSLANTCTPLVGPDPVKKKKKVRMEQVANSAASYSTPTTSSSSESSSCSDDSGSEPTIVTTNKGRRSGFRTNNAAKGPERPRRSQMSVSPPPSSCDLVILVGNQEFHYSSAILAYYASDYLGSRMVQRDLDNKKYYIDFSFHSTDEWKVVLDFLQPRSLGKAELTWQVLPTVLPWFAEFRMRVLLKDVDDFLLATVVGSPTDEREEVAISVPNLLLLTHISYASELETTQSQARQWLKSKLIQPRQLSKEMTENGRLEDHGEVVALDWTLADLQYLSRILANFKDVRNYLWESSLIMYLPHDLNVQDSYGMVSNPLFPYLLREGMMQLSIVQEQRKRKGGDVASTDFSSTTIRATHATEQKDRLNQDLLNVLLQGTLDNLEKFKKETEMGLAPSSKYQRQIDYSTRSKPKERRRQPRLKDMRSIVAETHPDDEIGVDEARSTSAVITPKGPRHRTFAC
jgi:hypothetical protein